MLEVDAFGEDVRGDRQVVFVLIIGGARGFGCEAYDGVLAAVSVAAGGQHNSLVVVRQTRITLFS